MTREAEIFLNEKRVAELWARIRQELDAKQDRVERDAATDAEVEELLDEVFGPLGGDSDRSDVAADEEIEEMLDEVFGPASKL